MKLSDLGEFGLIKKLQRKCPSFSDKVLTGIGDDAAVCSSGGKNTLVTTDMLVEQVHFNLSYTTFFQLGWKFLAVNISDILAMGGTPEYFLAGIAIPQKITAKDITDLYSGLNKIASEHKVSVIGGDTCASKDTLILSGTLIGRANKPLTRSGAEEGDGIYVTDTLGDSSMGLELLSSQGKQVTSFSPFTMELKLMKKHLMPCPVHLGNKAKVNSMIDISDGLLSDLGHICDESNVGAIIHKEKIPLSRELVEVSKKTGKDPYNYALKGGEDYTLLFTASSGYRTSAHKIGEIAEKGRYIVDDKGRKNKFKSEGYDHFR